MNETALLPTPRRRVLLSSVSSDSHTWNLVFLQLLMQESGHEVRNLGACVPDDLLLAECRETAPDLVVISTVNGHGYADGKRLIAKIRACPELRRLPVVIGGKLGVAGADDLDRAVELLALGFDSVHQDGADLTVFTRFVESVSPRRALETTAR